MVQGRPTHGKEMEERDFFFFNYHIESNLAQKTKILVSDISVRLSCQISRERYFS